MPLECVDYPFRLCIIHGKNALYQNSYSKTENEIATGGVRTTSSHKRRLAKQSLRFNMRNETFCQLFPEIIESHSDECEESSEPLIENDGPFALSSSTLETILVSSILVLIAYGMYYMMT